MVHHIEIDTTKNGKNSSRGFGRVILTTKQQDLKQWVMEHWILIGLLLVGVLGGALLLYTTDHGVDFGSDSVAYIAAAQNLLKGYGLSWVSGNLDVRPLVHYPPFYPMVLAAFEAGGLPATDAARILNALLFGSSIVLVGLIVYIASDTWYLALGAATLLLISGEQIEIHSWGMSEPLFITLSLVGILTLLLFLRRSSRIFLFLSALSIGLCAITRYIGFVYIPASILVLMLDQRLEIRERTRNAGAFLLIAGLPTLLWMLRNYILLDKFSNRTLAWGSQHFEWNLTIGLGIVLNWFLPLRIVEMIQSRFMFILIASMLGVITLLVIIFILYRRARGRTAMMDIVPDPFTILTIFALAFMGGMAFSVLLTLPTPDVNERILGPAYVFILMLITLAIGAALQTRKWIILLPVFILVAFLFRNKAVYAYWVIRDIHGSPGRFYTTEGWRNSPLIYELAAYPDETIYTDDIAAVYLHAERYSNLIPLQYDMSTGEPNANYAMSLKSVRDQVRSGDAIVVLFKPNSMSTAFVPLDELINGFEVVYEASGGIIVAADD